LLFVKFLKSKPVVRTLGKLIVKYIVIHIFYDAYLVMSYIYVVFTTCDYINGIHFDSLQLK